MNDDDLRLALAQVTAPPADVTERYQQVQGRVHRRKRRTIGLAAVSAAVVASSAPLWPLPDLASGGATRADTATAADPDADLVITCGQEMTLSGKTVTAGPAGVSVRVINDAPAEWGPASVGWGGSTAPRWVGGRSVPADGRLDLPVPPGPVQFFCMYGSNGSDAGGAENTVTVLDPQNLWPAAPSAGDMTCEDDQSRGGFPPTVTADDPEVAVQQVASAIGITVGDKATGYPQADERRTLLMKDGKAVAVAVTRLREGQWVSEPTACPEEFRTLFYDQAVKRQAELDRDTDSQPKPTN